MYHFKQSEKFQGICKDYYGTVRPSNCVCPDSGRSDLGQGAHTGAPLPTIIQWFKTMTTNEYVRGVKMFGWSPFHGRIWQRNYYEQIIRNEEDLHHIRQYIHDNPANWETDEDNPMVGADLRVRPDSADAHGVGAHTGAPLQHPHNDETRIFLT